MKNKVRWFRPGKNESAVVQVNEGNGWISYTASKLRVPDGEFSPGFTTFQKVIKHGYINEGLYENYQ